MNRMMLTAAAVVALAATSAVNAEPETAAFRRSAFEQFDDTASLALLPFPSAMFLGGQSSSGGGGGGTGHRYWRIKPLWMGSSETRFQAIEMRTVAGGSDATGSGTPFVTNPSGGGGAGGAFDHNSGTFAAIFSNGTIGYDFGVGNAPAIVEVAITIHTADYTAEFDVEYSDDGVTYTPHFGGTKRSGWTVGVAEVFTDPGAVASRHWRVRATTLVSGTTMACVECEMRETIGGADATGSGTASASTTYAFGSVTPDKAFDNNTGTLWSGDNSKPAASEWLAYDFGAGVTKTIQEIRWLARPDGNYTQSPTAGVVQSSADGKTWRHRYQFSGLTWSAGEAKVITTGYTIVRSTAPNATSTGWTGYSFRETIAASALADVTGNTARVTISAPPGSSLTITEAYIGFDNGGGSSSFTTTPTQLFFGGSASVTIPAGTSITSDAATLSSAYDGTVAMLVSAYIGSGTGTIYYSAATGSGMRYHNINNASSVSGVGGTIWDGGAARAIVKQIEIA